MNADVIIVGTGGMGSAAADALAGRGLRVLALDQFGFAHDRGSSHGRTRIVRRAYFESPAYVPLLRRAYALWDSFPSDCTLRRVGCLLLGPEASPVVVGATRSAAEEGITVELMTGAETAGRFPVFAPAADDVAVFEPDAGYVRPEETVTFLTTRARRRGAHLRRGVRVTGWDLVGDRVEVHTAGETFTSARLVLATGAWTGSLPGTIGLPVTPERRVMHFFDPSGQAAHCGPGAMPTFIWDLGHEDSIFRSMGRTASRLDSTTGAGLPTPTCRSPRARPSRWRRCAGCWRRGCRRWPGRTCAASAACTR